MQRGHNRRGLLVLCGGLAACVGSPGYPPSADTTDATGSAVSSGSSDSASGTSVATMGTTPGSSTSGSATTNSTTPTGTTDGPIEYDFVEISPRDYSQIDRAGFPATNTAMNILGDKDAFNEGTPFEDAALSFIDDEFESLETLHLGVPGMQTMDNTGLDDDMLALGLQPCTPPRLPMANCDDQMMPFVIPDVVAIDTDEPAAWPNGRLLSDPVMDLILAVLLLNLVTHEITLWTDLDGDGTPGPSLNPLDNDVAFQADFPYLAPPH